MIINFFCTCFELLLVVICGLFVSEISSFAGLSNNGLGREKGLSNDGLGKEKVLFVDDHIIVVNKPSNLQTAPGYLDKTSLATVISKSYKIPRIDQMVPHRLDYGTSGLILFARHIDALRGLQSQFRIAGSVYKRYVAIVNGTFDSDEGVIDSPIGKDIRKGPPYNCIDIKSGKSSVTKWQVIDRGFHQTMLNLKPETGRTHQLRVHLASIGHPIIGDFFYASPSLYKASSRLLLHSEELRLKHPVTLKDLHFTAPRPFRLRDFDRFIS